MPFSSEQNNEINNLIQAKKEEFAREASDSVKAVLNESMTAAARAAITQALGSNESLIIARFESKSGADKKARSWEIIQLALPVLLTVLLGALVWYLQHGVEERSKKAQQQVEAKIDQNTKFLEAQLALKQEYFKRKMDVLQEIWKQMAVVYGDANTAYVNPKETTKAISSLSDLTRLLDGNKLYLTDDSQTALESFWTAAQQLIRKQISPGELDAKRTSARDQIFKELELNGIGSLPHPNGSP